MKKETNKKTLLLVLFGIILFVCIILDGLSNEKNKMLMIIINCLLYFPIILLLIYRKDKPSSILIIVFSVWIIFLETTSSIALITGFKETINKSIDIIRLFISISYIINLLIVIVLSINNIKEKENRFAWISLLFTGIIIFLNLIYYVKSLYNIALTKSYLLGTIETILFLSIIGIYYTIKDKNNKNDIMQM